MHANTIAPVKFESFAMRTITDPMAGHPGVMAALSARLDLHQALADAGPKSAKEPAPRASRAERCVREWLSAQAAGGHVGHHAVSDTNEFSPEPAPVRTGKDSPCCNPHAWTVPSPMWFDEDAAHLVVEGRR